MIPYSSSLQQGAEYSCPYLVALGIEVQAIVRVEFRAGFARGGQ